MTGKNFFENSALNKKIEKAEESVDGKSEFTLFDGTTSVRVGYNKRVNGETGSKLVLSRYDLLNTHQELVYVFTPTCEIKTVKYNGLLVNKSQCIELQNLSNKRADFVGKASAIIKTNADPKQLSCDDLSQLQKACQSLTNRQMPQLENGSAAKDKTHFRAIK